MTTPIQTNPAYNEDAVFQPGTGAVYWAPRGTEGPTNAQLSNWATGDRTADIGEWSPLGYTSVDTLPGLNSETEGGEKMGVWENPDFRMSAITTTESVSVSPVQWSEIPIKHRFGNGATIDTSTGVVHVPSVYVAAEVSILVIILDGDRHLGLLYPRTSSAPDDNLELDPEQFSTLPVRYNVLQEPGNPDKFQIIAQHFITGDDGDTPEDDPEEDPEA